MVQRLDGSGSICVPSGPIMIQPPYATIQKKKEQAQKHRDSLNIPEVK